MAKRQKQHQSKTEREKSMASIHYYDNETGWYCFVAQIDDAGHMEARVHETVSCMNDCSDDTLQIVMTPRILAAMNDRDEGYLFKLRLMAEAVDVARNGPEFLRRIKERSPFRRTASKG